MYRTLQNLIREELCPGGIWQLTDVMKSVLRYQMSRLPRSKISQTGTRYPTTPAGMWAFLDVFFTRHYFQNQHSLLDYMASDEFVGLLTSGELQILDVGCGPAVASLAITDMLVCIIKHLKQRGEWPKDRMVKVSYVLNDTSGICLGTGQCMLMNYFRIGREYSKGITRLRTISVQKAFPGNMNQIRRIARNLGTYDIVALSYVVVPLDENNGFNTFVNGILEVERLCGRNGRTLILQDRFNASLMRRISKAIGVSSHKEQLTQYVYPSRNVNETYTYSYYSCLYAPTKQIIAKADCVA